MAAVTFRAETFLKSKTGNFACLIRSAKAAIVSADAYLQFQSRQRLNRFACHRTICDILWDR